MLQKLKNLLAPERKESRTGRLIALDGGGRLVSAHVRTTAQRKGRLLDIPSLLLFELSLVGVRRVTELPGDLDAWNAFWS